MKSVTVWLAVVVALTEAVFCSEKKEDGLQVIHEDALSLLQTWQHSSEVQEYLLSGQRRGISVGLRVGRDGPSQGTINLGADRSLSVHSIENRFVLSLFHADASGEVSVLYDLDSSGSWDVKVWRSGKFQVVVQEAWRDASNVERILSGIPHAIVDGRDYKFSNGKWVRSIERADGNDGGNDK